MFVGFWAIIYMRISYQNFDVYTKRNIIQVVLWIYNPVFFFIWNEKDYISTPAYYRQIIKKSQFHKIKNMKINLRVIINFVKFKRLSAQFPFAMHDLSRQLFWYHFKLLAQIKFYLESNACRFTTVFTTKKGPQLIFAITFL